MFEKILIANRGEIACRIIRSCRRFGVRTVAVYSEADQYALHGQMADEAHPIGPAPAAESYLVGDRLIALAQRTGAQAIHPGYGFLSENAAFAQAVVEAGLVFVGPPAEAIRAMGDKSAAKTRMRAAGVPVVPGYEGEDQSLERFLAEAERTGYPVLLKASAGGGGKGMRRVDRAEDLEAALTGARRESQKAFGDQRMLLEKYILGPRHIEVQVFADSHGQVVHLFERDCSVQRRHQKVVEEAPAPGISQAMRTRLGTAAVEAARAIDYVGAGTVEFIADADENFYFMEMNTRLQVEHPVTEMVTGQDLVAWQLQVASGEPLPHSQDELEIKGHAIEVRLYAEDPGRDFLPASGWIEHLEWPEASPYLRVETGVQARDRISVHYDPMLAKLVVWDASRALALRRLRRALDQTRIAGLCTNLAFLYAVANHPEFAAGSVTTDFIARNRDDLIPEQRPADDPVLAAAVLHLLLERAQVAKERAAQSCDPRSPWTLAEGWRLNDQASERVAFEEGPEVEVAYLGGGCYQLALPGGRYEARARLEDHELVFSLDGARQRATVVAQAQQRTVMLQHRVHTLTHIDPLASVAHVDDTAGSLTSPMPGRIIEVLVEVGAAVTRGQPLLILEAMKMEHTVSAPADGVVEALHFPVGALVEEGVVLVAFAASGSEKGA